MKLVRGQALTQTIAIDGHRLVQQVYELQYLTPDKWYKDIVCYFLNQKYLSHLNLVHKRVVRMKS